jgi:hypothetical protein
MVTSATSYEAIAANNVANMVASSTTFQTLVGVGTSAAALAFITDTWGGTPGRDGGQNLSGNMAGTTFQTVAPFAVVRPDPMESSLHGVGWWDRTGQMEIQIFQLRLLPSEVPASTLQRCRNVHGGIRSDMESLFGSAGCMATGEITGEFPIFLDDTGVDLSAIMSVLKLRWWA